MSTSYGFDRPVFILAAPRSGSTLLFETLLQSDVLWTIGDESHGVFEKHRALRPGQGCDNNRLLESNCSDALLQAIHAGFLTHLRNREGVAYDRTNHGLPRLLEKTPKNALRIPFLNKIFPDALFIYLCRDPKENISSIIEAWRSGRFVTYPRKTGRHGPWSLLLPPGWWEVQDKPLENIAAFQWQAAHEYIIQDLKQLPKHRYMMVNYAEFVENTLPIVEKLSAFMNVPLDEHLKARAENPLPMARYSMPNPTKNKWHRNGQLIANVLPNLAVTIDAINTFMGKDTRKLSDETQIDISTIADLNAQEKTKDASLEQRRNAACDCGSGKKYKSCHGKM